MPKADGKTIQQRFNERYEVDKKTGCWNWTAGLSGKGYAYIWLPINRPGARYPTDGSTLQAAKVGWLLSKRLPWSALKGLDLHHKCENPKCVNPKHLKPRTRKQHFAEHRKKECKKGHKYTKANTFINVNGARVCKACAKESRAKYYAAEVARRKAEGTYLGPGAQRTKCKMGHAFTPENTRIAKDGSRVCRKCRDIWYFEKSLKKNPNIVRKKFKKGIKYAMRVRPAVNG